MAEKRSFPTPVTDADPSLQINRSASVTGSSDFCLFCEDDIEMDDNEEDLSESVHSHEDPFTNVSEAADSLHHFSDSCSVTSQADLSMSVDMETMKRKAEEIANSLRKIRSTKDVDADVPSVDYEPPEELKRYRERSLYVAQKLKEDRLLFEESKKRNEAVVDKVRTVKRIHRNISESAKELKKDETLSDETAAIRLKVGRLEASLLHLQKIVVEKNQIISEKNETIQTLNEAMISTNGAYMGSLNQSKDEIQKLKEEYSKAVERITTSSDEFRNQLQTVRKKCLVMENDLKLSEFARCRLVSCNAELREKISKLERMSLTANFESDVGSQQRSTTDEEISTTGLRPKIESIAAIVDEFRSYLADTCIEDFENIDMALVDNDDDECDLLQSIDRIGDKLQSTFYIVRDRLSGLSDLQETAKQMEAKLKKLHAANEESKTQASKMKEILADTEAQIQVELNAKQELVERLRKTEDHLKLSDPTFDPDKPLDYDEMNNQQSIRMTPIPMLNERIKLLQQELLAKEYECELMPALNDRIQQLQQELSTKVNECDGLRRTCEQLEDSNDKLESDFVVLQKRDYEDEDKWKRNYAKLKEENEKLLQNIHLMSENAMQHENERLFLYKHIEESESLKQTVADLNSQLDAVKKESLVMHTSKMEYESEMREEVDILSAEMDQLTKQLMQAKEQLAEEVSFSRNLKEQVKLTENTIEEMSEEVQDLRARLQAEKVSKEERAKEFEVERIRLDQHLKHATLAISNLEDNLSQQNAQLELLKRQNEELMREGDRVWSEKQELEQYKAMASSSESLKRENEQLASTIKQLQQQIHVLENEKAQLEYEMKYADDARLESLNSQIIFLTTENQQLTADYEQCCQQALLLQQNIDQLQSRNKYVEDENNVLKVKCEQSSPTIDVESEVWKSKFNELQNNFAPLQQEVNRLKLVVADLEQAKAAASKRAADIEEVVKCTEASLQEAYNELEKKTRGWGAAEKMVDELKGETQRLRGECEEYRSRIADLKEIRSRGQTIADEAILLVDELRCTINLLNDQLQEAYNNGCRDEADRQQYITSQLTNELESLQQEYCYLQKSLQERDHDECNQLKAELESLRQKCWSLENTSLTRENDYRTQIRGYELTEASLRKDLDEIKKSLDETSLLLQQKNNNIDTLHAEMKGLVSSERARYECEKVDAVVQVDEVQQEHVTANEGRKSPALMKYFDYYKDKITKGVSDILQPEEQQQMVDYSNWILPEKQDAEYQTRYQQVPEFSAECSPSTEDEFSAAMDPASAVDSTGETLFGPVPEVCHRTSQTVPTKQKSSVVVENVLQPFDITPRSVSAVVDQLRKLILDQVNKDQWPVDDMEWSSEELDMYNENFVDTALKFVDLFEVVVKYYAALPGTEVVVNKLKDVSHVSAPAATATVEVNSQRIEADSMNHREAYVELVTLTTRLECENKYLLDAINFVEDAIIARQSMAPQLGRFHSVCQSWRQTDMESDIIDRICEEYDIVPSKFTVGEMFTTWKETIVKLLEPTAIALSSVAKSSSPLPDVVEPLLVTVMKKMHQLIGDLYYKYSPNVTFDPNEFFDQIDDINRDVERIVKVIRGEVVTDSHSHEEHHGHDHRSHEAEQHHHDHDDDHHHDHGHDDHRENEADPNLVAELKSMLAESSRKIDSLVRELMEMKNSREYNEVRQIHVKLDETLYQLHLKDVHVVELTQELTQLLSERDSLQLKLSSIIRENEQLREAYLSSNTSENSGMSPVELNKKLEELHNVNYMKDPRISEATKQYRATEKQLFNYDQRGTSQKGAEENVSGFSASLFKWLTGDSDNK